jgi:2,4-dienoyl-CoA reductase (NADPH2)
LKDKNVTMMSSVHYEKIDDDGLHIHIKGEKKLLKVDHVVICAGQEPLRDLVAELTHAQVNHHLIGGADIAVELDAKRAIHQGAHLAATL